MAQRMFHTYGIKKQNQPCLATDIKSLRDNILHSQSYIKDTKFHIRLQTFTNVFICI